MCCDMIGAPKAYLKTTYNPAEPLKYFEDQCDKWVMDKDSLEELRKMLTEVAKEEKYAK